MLEVGGPRPDLLVVCVSDAHLAVLEDVNAAIHRLLDPRTSIGLTAHTLLDARHETDGHPALAAFALWVGGAAIRPVRLDERCVDPARRPERSGLLASVTASADPDSTLVLLTDPLTLPLQRCVGNRGPTVESPVVVGTAAASGRTAGSSRLLLDGDVHRDGAVALLVDASVGLHAAAAEGRRPIGAPLVVTRAEGGRIHELAGRPALVRLREALETLDEHRRSLVRGGLWVGRAVDERLEHLRSGDFDLHELRGTERDSDTLVIDGEVPVGSTVQMHIADPSAALEELACRLGPVEPLGGLVFDGTGRLGIDPADVIDVVRTGAVVGTGGAGAFGPGVARRWIPNAAMSMVVLTGPSR